VTATSSSSSALSATGSASLAGTLSVASADGTYRLGQKLTVLTAAGGVNGTFSLAQVTATGATFSSALSYDADNVYLQIDLSRLTPLLPTGSSANQTAVVGGIDAAIAAGDSMPLAIENLGNDSSAQLAGHADQLSGEIGADASLAAASLFAPFLDAVFDHLSAEQPRSMAVWGSAFAGSNIVAADAASGAHRFKSTLTGVVAGANWMPWSNLMLGGALSAGTSDFSLAGDLGKGHAAALQAALYGHMQLSSHFYNAFAVAAALADIKTQRLLTVSGSDQLNGKLTATVVGGRYEAGILLPWTTPYVAAQDVFTSLPAYSESAASGSDTFALRYASRTLNNAGVEVGLRQDTDVAVTPRWILTPDWTMHLTAKLAWAHEFEGGSDASAQFLALPSSGFSLGGAKAGKDAALVSAGADFLFDNGLRITSRIDSAFSSKSQSFTGYAGLGYRW
jgi:outer membrane autotransporter protein